MGSHNLVTGGRAVFPAPVPGGANVGGRAEPVDHFALDWRDESGLPIRCRGLGKLTRAGWG